MKSLPIILLGMLTAMLCSGCTTKNIGRHSGGVYSVTEAKDYVENQDGLRDALSLGKSSLIASKTGSNRDGSDVVTLAYDSPAHGHYLVFYVDVSRDGKIKAIKGGTFASQNVKRMASEYKKRIEQAGATNVKIGVRCLGAGWRYACVTDARLSDINISDLSPLKGMNLMSLSFTPRNVTNGIDIIRNMPTLQYLGTNNFDYMPPADFWEKFDAGEFE